MTPTRRAKLQWILRLLGRKKSGTIFSECSSCEQTRWDRIIACYELLEKVAPSALHRLNRAVALAEWQGPEKGLILHRRCQNEDQSKQYRTWAIKAAPNAAIRDLLKRRLQGHSGESSK